MRIVRVHLRPFGPFRDRRLELTPGMNVIYGPNEAGKSSLHAAIYAGLCGMRRGRGRRAADREFEERYRPWSGEGWAVEIDLALGDGRRIQIAQDLDGQVDSRAIDLDTGRDLTGDLLNEGTPDGSRLLGLTRDILPETICIRQADVLRVLANAGELQEQLQRAAAAGGAGEPAEAAIRRLEEFKRERVGKLRAGGRRPHQAAVHAVDDGRKLLERARAAHADYLTLVDRRNEAEVEAREAEAELRAIERAVARGEVEQCREKVERVRRLAAGFPDGPPPDPSLQLRQLSTVREALAAFDARPSAPATPQGRSAAEIEAEIRALPRGSPEPAEREEEKEGDRSAGRLWPAGAAAMALGLLLALLADGALRLAGVGLIGLGLALLVASLRRSPARRPDVELAELQAEARASLRNRLEAELASRRALEREVERAQTRRADAERKVRGAAETAGAGGGSLDETVRALRALTDRIEREVELRTREREEWATLQELLAGRSPDDLEAELSRLERELPPEPAGGDELPDGARLQELQREAEERLVAARRDLDNLDGQVAVVERDLPDVVAAEEALEQAQQELQRVESLKETLERTLEFLGDARDRIQRDVAPVLKESVEAHLARITGGRYEEAIVDPSDLKVWVRTAGATWREASRLSHGTREQIYLLLRLGLAGHLVTTGEPAPVLLDDPTVQCDAERTVAFLDLLHRVSRERQVVLFSQEQEVLEWARRLPACEDDLLIEMRAIPANGSP